MALEVITGMAPGQEATEESSASKPVKNEDPADSVLSSSAVTSAAPIVDTRDNTHIVKPGLHDVLLGRGGGTNNHCGNIKFRKLVNEHKLRYLACSKIEKPKVAREVVGIWRKLDPPGRFLARVDDKKRGPGSVKDTSNVWYEVGDKKAREKASQCLRERTRDVMPYLKQLREQQDQLTEESAAILQYQFELDGPEAAAAAAAANTEVDGNEQPNFPLSSGHSCDKAPTVPCRGPRSSSPDKSVSNSKETDVPMNITSAPDVHASRRGSIPSSVESPSSMQSDDANNFSPPDSNELNDLTYNSYYQLQQQQLQQQMEMENGDSFMGSGALAAAATSSQNTAEMLQQQFMMLNGTSTPQHQQQVMQEQMRQQQMMQQQMRQQQMMQHSQQLQQQQMQQHMQAPQRQVSTSSHQTHQQQHQQQLSSSSHHQQLNSSSHKKRPSTQQTSTGPNTAKPGTAQGQRQPSGGPGAATQAGGHDVLTLEEYQKTLQAYLSNNQIPNGGEGPGGDMNHDSDLLDFNENGSEYEEDFSVGNDEGSGENQVEAKAKRSKGDRERGVQRTRTGNSLMSMRTTKSTGLSIISGIESIDMMSAQSLCTRESKMTMARSVGSNYSLMSELTDISHTIDNLTLGDD